MQIVLLDGNIFKNIKYKIVHSLIHTRGIRNVLQRTSIYMFLDCNKKRKKRSTLYQIQYLCVNMWIKCIKDANTIIHLLIKKLYYIQYVDMHRRIEKTEAIYVHEWKRYKREVHNERNSQSLKPWKILNAHDLGFVLLLM